MRYPTRSAAARVSVLAMYSVVLLLCWSCNFYRDYSSIDVTGDAGPRMDATTMGFVPECLEPSGERLRHVATDGASDGDGSRDAPLDLATAIDEARPGDEIVLSSGVYDDGIDLSVSGTPQAPIIIRADVRHEAVFSLSASNSVAFRLEGVSHVVADGFEVTDSTSRWLLIRDSSDITFSDSRFGGHTGVGVPAVVDDSQRITLEDNVLGDTRKHAALESENSRQLRLIGNLFGVTPGSTVEVIGGDQIVMRGNVFANVAGLPLKVLQSDHVLVEGNVFTSAIEGPGSGRSTAKITTSNLIMRRNRFVRNWGTPVWFAFTDDDYRADHTRMYHNVFAYNRDESYYDGEGFFLDGGGTFSDVVAFNNLFIGNGGSGARQLRAEQLSGQASVEHNHFWDAGQTPLLYYDSESLSVPEAESEAPDVFTNNTVGAPSLEVVEAEDFRPDGTSPLLDTARPLTTVTGGMSPGTIIEVDDPHVFYDGYGLEEEEGDFIAIGSPANTARVVAVDRTAGTVELHTEVEFAPGDPVSAPWAGASPDIGVFERGRPPVSVSLSSPRPDVGEEVTLTARLSEDITPVRMEWRSGDGTIYCEQSPSHTWSVPGNYGLRLTVVDTAGRTHRASHVIHVGHGADDPTSLDFALQALDEALCDGTAHSFTGDQTGLTEVGPKDDGEGYTCVAP